MVEVLGGSTTMYNSHVSDDWAVQHLITTVLHNECMYLLTILMSNNNSLYYPWGALCFRWFTLPASLIHTLVSAVRVS